MDNYGLKFIRLFLVTIAICGAMVNGCKDAQEPPDVPIVPIVPIPPFKPGYFKDEDENKRHLSIHFNIDTGKLLIDKMKNGELRPGKLPYHPGGNTEVVYKDINGEEIERYSIADPTTLRSCELINGKRDGVFRPDKGKVELLFPANPDIAFIDIINADDRGGENVIDVSKIVEDAFKNRKREKKKVPSPPTSPKGLRTTQ